MTIKKIVSSSFFCSNQSVQPCSNGTARILRQGVSVSTHTQGTLNPIRLEAKMLLFLLQIRSVLCNTFHLDGSKPICQATCG